MEHRWFAYCSLQNHLSSYICDDAEINSTNYREFVSINYLTYFFYAVRNIAHI